MLRYVVHRNILRNFVHLVGMQCYVTLPTPLDGQCYVTLSIYRGEW
jgi:hypothetical protein